MSNNTDESLADEGTEVVDATGPQVEAEDFDWNAFLSGVRSTRRAVKVYGRADLVADMEEAAGNYRDDMPAQEKKRLVAEITRLRDEFEASGRWFVAEARSSDWQEKFRKDAAKRLGVDIGEDESDPSPEQVAGRKAVQTEQAAAQIVSPTGVTAEGLARLGEINEGELNKIVTAVAFANGQQAQSAGVLKRDFSPAPSAQKRGSTKR